MSTTQQEQQTQSQQFDQAWHEQQQPGDSVLEQAKQAEDHAAAQEQAESNFKAGWSAE